MPVLRLPLHLRIARLPNEISDAPRCATGCHCLGSTCPTPSQTTILRQRVLLVGSPPDSLPSQTEASSRSGPPPYRRRQDGDKDDRFVLIDATTFQAQPTFYLPEHMKRPPLAGAPKNPPSLSLISPKETLAWRCVLNLERLLRSRLTSPLRSLNLMGNERSDELQTPKPRPEVERLADIMMTLQRCLMLRLSEELSRGQVLPSSSCSDTSQRATFFR